MGGVDLQGRLRLALGTVKDHASIGKAIIHMTHDTKGFPYLEIAVLRATGHHYCSNIDDKHMHEILFLANSPGSIPFLAERISRRLSKTRDRLVALKTLLLVHRLLRGGNRCFEQQLRKAHASGHLQLRTNWFSHNSSDPSVRFLHSYSAYLEERIGWVINPGGKLEPSVTNQFGGSSSSADMVFRKLPKCQSFIDRVLDCFPFACLPTFDTLYGATMTNVLKESFQVYAAYSEGVAVLMNMLFDLTADARELGCRILKRASRQSQLLDLMYDRCKKVIRNENLEYPLVEIVSAEHVAALAQLQGDLVPISPPEGWNLPPPPVTDGGSRALTVTSVEKDGGGVGDGSLFGSSRSMETRISEVWVVFEDDEFR